jgi:hypothetical protein
MLSGYVPPEEDAEYRPMVKKSLWRSTSTEKVNSEYSDIDREGDIVLCPGKWKGETILARVRFIQYSESSEGWLAELLPLKDGKSDGVFCIDKNEKSLLVRVTELQPVRSFYIRSENGYRISMKKNSTTEFLLKAPRYRYMDRNYTLPRKVFLTTVFTSVPFTHHQIDLDLVA